MAIYYAHYCGRKGCGQRVVNNDKLKRYIHADMAPEREGHRPIIRTVKMTEQGERV